MANENRTILIDIQSNYQQMVNNLVQVTSEIERLRAQSRQLNAQLKAGEISQEDYAREIVNTNLALREQQAQQRTLQSDITATRNAEREHAGSLADLSIEVNALTRQYDMLSRAERESAQGTELLDSIKEKREELNEARQETGRFQAQVGNYENAITSALSANNSFIASLIQTAQAEQAANVAAGDMSGSFVKATATGNILTRTIRSIGVAVKQLTAVIIANPIIAVLAAIALAITAIINVIKSSEEATNRVSRLLAPFNALLSRTMNILQGAVSIILSVVEAFASFAGAISRVLERLPLIGPLIKSVNDEVERSVQLEERRAELAAQERDQLVANAQTANQVAKLRADAQDRENLSAEQRLQKIREANALDQANAEAQLELVRRRLAIAEEEASLSENTAQTEQELAQLRASVYDQETQYFNRLRELRGQEISLINEIKTEQKSQADEAKKQADEAIKRGQEAVKIRQEQYATELQIRRNYEDSLLELMQRGSERTERELRVQASRRIEDLKRELTTTKNLTENARRDINSTIVLVERQLAEDLNTLYEQTDRENFQKETQRQQTNLQNRLAVLRENSEEALNIRLEQLRIQREVEIREAETTGVDTAAIRTRFDYLEQQEQQSHQQQLTQQLVEEQRARFENQLLEAQIQGRSRIEVELEQRRTELSQLTQLQDESDALYLERRKNLMNQIAISEQDLAEETLNLQMQQIDAVASVFGAASELVSSFCEQNEALAAFSKALALFEIGLNTAKAISAGIAAAQSVPFPGNLAAIATTVATVLSNIARATQLVNQETQPKANFAEGGLVTGPGSGTSDSVPINASNGESIIVARATDMFSPLLSSINQLGGGIPITTQSTSAQVEGEEMLARAFERAIQRMPNPVVGVDEIVRVQKRVQVLERNVNA